MLVSIFRLGDIYLGINIVLIREINRSSNCTPVPGCEDYIRGMLNIRGRVITLFDLKRRLGWSDDSHADVAGKRKGYNVILKTHDEVQVIDGETAEHQCTWEDPVGLTVDELDDVTEIDEDSILPPPANLEGMSADFVQGVVEQQERLLILLDVKHTLGVGKEAGHLN